MNTSTMNETTYLVIGQNYWGEGATEAEAKKNWSSQGGRRLSNGYTVVEFPPGTEFDHVDAFGSAYWNWPEGVTEEARVQPIITKHAARKPA